MKKRELGELRELKVEELVKRVEGLRKDLDEVKVKIAVGEERNKKAAKKLKRDLAQILNIIAQKENKDERRKEEEK